MGKVVRVEPTVVDCPEESRNSPFRRQVHGKSESAADAVVKRWRSSGFLRMGCRWSWTVAAGKITPARKTPREKRELRRVAFAMA
jgi:hypothetical protein